MQASSRISTTQTIAFTASSVPIANAFGTETYQVRLVADAACNFRIGDGAQTATAADPFLPPNWVTYFTVSPGQRISAIRAATDGVITATSGTLWVSEMA